MFRRIYSRLRMVDAPAQTGSNDPDSAAEPHGDEQDIDWKARYEETLAHSREWERRAKANKAAAEELEQLKESTMSETQKAQNRAEKLQKELDEIRGENQRRQWRAQVAEETGLPADICFGSTLEEMQSNAQAVGTYVESLQAKPASSGYVLQNPAKQPSSDGSSELTEFLGTLFSKQ